MIEKLRSVTVPSGELSPDNFALMNKLNELIEAHNITRGLMDSLFKQAEKDKQELRTKIDQSVWLNAYCAALNKNGDIPVSKDMADESLKVFKDRFPDKEAL